MGERYDLHTLALMTANAVQEVLEDGGEDGPLMAQDCIKDVLRVERQAREAAEAELAALRERVACCEQCAQSVIDPACIFCGHEPDTTEGGEHG